MGVDIAPLFAGVEVIGLAKREAIAGAVLPAIEDDLQGGAPGGEAR